MFLKNLIQQQARRRPGQDFRKSLGVYSFKLKKIGYHKRPGLVPIKIKEELKKRGTERATQQIKRIEQNSQTPYLGKFRGRRFFYDENKMDQYVVPDLTGFTLKPYVSVHTPKVSKELLDELDKLNDYRNPENFNRYQQIEEK